MKIVTEEFTETVENLIRNLQTKDFSHEKERQFSKEHNVLPLGPDLDCDVFLSPKGEVIWTDYEAEFASVNTKQALIKILVVERDNFPQLSKFIPNSSDDSKDCFACQGTKKLRSGNELIKCFICVGLGWVTKEAWEGYNKSQES